MLNRYICKPTPPSNIILKPSKRITKTIHYKKAQATTNELFPPLDKHLTFTPSHNASPPPPTEIINYEALFNRCFAAQQANGEESSDEEPDYMRGSANTTIDVTPLLLTSAEKDWLNNSPPTEQSISSAQHLVLLQLRETQQIEADLAYARQLSQTQTSSTDDCELTFENLSVLLNIWFFSSKVMHK